MVVNLILTPTQAQKNLEAFVPVEDPTSNAISVWDGTASQTAPSGSGTSESDPYIIDSAQKLAWISANYDGQAKGKYFKQTVNIDLNNIAWTPINPTNNTSEYCYYYDGDSHTISKLSVSSTKMQHVGLFGVIYNGYIKNLGIESGTVNSGTADGPRTGALIGMVENNFFMENCYNQASVSGGCGVAGLIGAAYLGSGNSNLYVKNCYNTGSLTLSVWDCGGIIGSAYSAVTTIENCYNTGSITGTIDTTRACGGIMGVPGRGSVKIINCYNSGNITAGYRSGGIAGWDNGTTSVVVKNCYNTGNVSLTSSTSGGAGGVFGYFNNPLTSAIIENCYNIGSVSGNNALGGIVGVATQRGTTHILDCCNEGSVTGDVNDCGGIVGWHSGSGQMTIENCSNSGKISTTTGSGYAGIIAYGNNLTLEILNCSNSGEIVAYNNNAGGCCGFMEYGIKQLTIKTFSNSGNIKTTTAANVAGVCANFRCVGSIEDCTNSGIIIVATSYGAGIVGVVEMVGICKVSNCSNSGTISGNGVCGGIIAMINADCTAEISCCNNVGNISVTAGSSAGIIGWGIDRSRLFVTDCFNTGAVSVGNADSAGGIGGAISDTYLIKNCFNTGKMTSTSGNAGGICGYVRENGTIETCYNTGELNSKNATGGIVGYMNGPMSTSHSSCVIRESFNSSLVKTSGSGAVGGIFGASVNNTTINLINCYYNTDLFSGNPVGSRGTTNSFYFSNVATPGIAASSMKSTADGTKPSTFADEYKDKQWRFVNGQIPVLWKIFALPKFESSLTYTGRTQHCGVYGLDSNFMTITGDQSAINAGTYSLTVTLKDAQSKWSDRTNASVTIYWTIEKASIDKPSVAGLSFTFNGTAQAPKITGFDSGTMEITGTQSATNAGSYQFSIVPKSNYQWSSGGSDALTFNWTIAKASVSASILPSQSGSLTYTGNPQNVSWTAYDTTKLTVGGTTSASNAGTYFATFTLNSNYQFSDGSVSKQVEWSIGKQVLTNPSLDLENNQTTFSGTTKEMSDYLQNFDGTKMTIEGNTQAIRAGTYIFVVSLKPEYQNNYIFANGQNFVVIAWTILPYNLENATIVVGGN